MDQHDSLSAPVQSDRCGGLLACPAGRQQKADHCRLHGICAGAHPEQRVLCPQFQLLCPVVLYAGAHPCGYDGERVGGPQPRPRPPRPDALSFVNDRHAGLCHWCPSQDATTKEWSLGVLQNPGQYCAVLAFGLGGLAVYHCICRRWQQRRVFARRLLAGVLAFSCLFGIVHIGIGKFGQWNTDSDLVEQYINALALKEDLPEGDWRIDTYKTHDNLGLWLDKSCLQYFGSTAAPSILSFYPALGVKRDVRSQPELSNYALRGLLSVRYLLTTLAHQKQFHAEADEGWTYYDTLDGYVLYENQNYVPMGFTYDYYLTEAQYEDTVTPTRSNLLMRALVLTEEDAVAYGQYLTPLPTAELNDLTYTRYTQDCADRRASACTAFEMNSAGFHAEATLDRTNLMFFSVPYDDGFTAYVDGQETEILRVDEGLMAVLCPAGTVTIDFVYQPDGIRLSRTVTLAALPVFLLYTGYFAWDEKKKRKH